MEAVLTTMLNEMAECPGDVVFILDDYHVIESQPIDATASIDDALMHAIASSSE